MIQQFTTKKDVMSAFSHAMNLISPEVENHHEKVAYLAFRLAQIMGINARIYYGSFYEYDDELDEDTDENDSEEEIGDDEGDADIQEESFSDDEEIEVSFEAVGETEEELSGEIDGVISDEDDAEEGSHTEEQAEEESHDDEEIEDKSSTAADRIKNMRLMKRPNMMLIQTQTRRKNLTQIMMMLNLKIMTKQMTTTSKSHFRI